MQTYAISVPQDSVWQPDRAQQLIMQLLPTFPHLVFQIVADARDITWRLLDHSGYSEDALRRAVLASYPDAIVRPQVAGLSPLFHQPVYRSVLKYQQSAETFLAPLQYVADLGHTDPLATVVHSMSHLENGEHVVFSLIVDGLAEDVRSAGQAQITRNVYSSLLSLAFPQQVPRYEPQIQRMLETKLQAPLYRCMLFIQIDSPRRERVTELAVIDSQIGLFDRHGFSGLRRYGGDMMFVTQITSKEADYATQPMTLYRQLCDSDIRSQELDALRSAVGLILEPRELAALWHLPHQGFTAPGILWAPKKPVSLSQELAGQRDGLRLGTAIFRGKVQPVYLPKSVRTAHLSVIGKTRTGKSTFLHHLIHQDIEAGAGVAVIDPHGDLIRDILRSSIPSRRESDVVILDIADTDHPPPLNLLATTRGDRSLTTASAVASLLTGLYGDMTDVPRAKNTLASVLATLWQDNNPTLLDVERLFEEQPYREELLQHLGVEHLRLLQFWRHYDLQSEAMREQLRAPILYRMQAFYGNPVLLPMICHPDSLSISDLMEQDKIILISLAVDDELIPKPDQDLLGAILVASFQRSSQNRKSRHLFALYIDEVQRFVTTGLPQLFAEVGKRNISVTVANQYYKQLSGETLDAVIGNVGSVIAFRVGHEDARIIAPYLKPAFSADDLIQQDNHQAIAWVGQTSFSLTPEPPFVVNNALAEQREAALRQLSREHYTPKSRTSVLEWLNDRYIRQTDRGSHEPELRYDPDD